MKENEKFFIYHFKVIFCFSEATNDIYLYFFINIKQIIRLKEESNWQTQTFNYLKKIWNIRLNNKIENNSTLDRAFCESEWVRINWVSVILVIHSLCAAANASELFCMAHLANIEWFLYHSNLPIWISNFICMKIRQHELTKINSGARKCIFSQK